MSYHKNFYRVEEGYCTFCHQEGGHADGCLLLMTVPLPQDSPTVSADEILESIQQASKALDRYSAKMLEACQEVFKEYFGADYARGDIVVFPRHRKASYDRLISSLPGQMAQRLKLGMVGLDSIMVLNGNYIKDFTCNLGKINE